MLDPFGAISAVVSVIMLVVFFIMAKNISLMKTEISDMKRIVMGYAKKDGILKDVECPHCHKHFKTAHTDTMKCPFCSGLVMIQ